MVHLTRQLLLRGALLPLIVAPPAAYSSDDLATAVRRAIVQGAQLADQADSVWQQVAGEVVPAWQQSQGLSSSNVPPASLDEAFARALLSIPLEVGAQCCSLSVLDLESRLPKARREAVLLYEDGLAAPTPLNNEPLYGKLDSGVLHCMYFTSEGYAGIRSEFRERPHQWGM